MNLRLIAAASPPQAGRLIAIAFVAVSAVAAEQPGALARARAAYNLQHYDEAIAAAREATRVPETAVRAQLLMARASLERFRVSGEAADLATARTTLAAIEPSTLASRDRGEMQIGLAELLFFDDRFGAAADLFEDALSRTSEPAYGPRERLLGWFATSLDRQARLEETPGRRRIYRRLLDRMVVQQRTGPGSAAASYWIVAATFGIDNVEDAWDAAVAAWIRAPLTPGDGVALRADLDHLVLEVIIPRRARLASAGGAVEPAAEVFRKDWESVKQTWPRR
ncbi:MAG: hypothetical protein NTV05_01840 [Acidobacteria bacterium]|nr:hypothetical protein [Acidobacteriota bacterium]